MLTRSLVEPFDNRAKDVERQLDEQERNRLFFELDRDIKRDINEKPKPYSYPSETTDEVLRAPLMGLFGGNKKVNQTMLVVQHENAISFLEGQILQQNKQLQYFKYRNNMFPLDRVQTERMEVLEKSIADNTDLLKRHQDEREMEQARLEEILPTCEKVLEDSYLAQMAKIFF
jgi:hypothetical protein